jgi:hypothetical protein
VSVLDHDRVLAGVRINDWVLRPGLAHLWAGAEIRAGDMLTLGTNGLAYPVAPRRPRHSTTAKRAPRMLAPRRDWVVRR